MMSITATVQNDTIRLPAGVHLPDGTPVRVEALERTNPARSKGSVFDLPPLDLGSMLRPLTGADDLLEEMLDGDARF